MSSENIYVYAAWQEVSDSYSWRVIVSDGQHVSDRGIGLSFDLATENAIKNFLDRKVESNNKASLAITTETSTETLAPDFFKVSGRKQGKKVTLDDLF